MHVTKTLCRADLILAGFATRPLPSLGADPNSAPVAAAAFNEIPTTPAVIGALPAGGRAIMMPPFLPPTQPPAPEQ
jgi:hypothetical protein